jgi:hypothetical protein
LRKAKLEIRKAKYEKRNTKSDPPREPDFTGPKNEKAGRMPALQKRNASRVARRSTEREYYIPAMMRSKVENTGHGKEVEAAGHPSTWKTLLAFAILYQVWGATFLAIRVGVCEVPPFLFAAIRFLIAGLVLYGWMIAQGERSPSRVQWASASLLAILFFVFDYGLLYWAEQRVPSGIAAVMMATTPTFMALWEITFLKTQKLTVRLALALLIGTGGVAVLVSHKSNLGGVPIDRMGAVALVIASMSWSISSVLTAFMR